MSDIFREVDEDLRREKAEALWKKYGSYVLIVVLAIVLGTAGRVGWKNYREAQLAETATRYQAVLEQAARDPGNAAAQALQAAQGELGEGYGRLSQLHQAAELSRAGDLAGAIAVYDRLAASNDPTLAGLASLLAGAKLIEAGERDQARGRLTSLVDARSPWRFTAGELLAVIDLEEGKREAARDKYQALSEDAEAPANLRARAAQMVRILERPA